jgi:uncharacterized protein
MASSLQVNIITNANLYVDGLGLMGRAAEITVPKPKHKMVEHQGLGMAGSAEFWAGIDKLEAKIKWSSLYPEVESQVAGPFTSHSFQIWGDLQQQSSMGLAGEVPVQYIVTGIYKDAGDTVFKRHEPAESTSTIAIYHCEEWIGGVQMFLYDVMANIYVVGGVDQLAQFRANLGG